MKKRKTISSSALDGVDFSKVRIKLFGPTLDDTMLYGVDRLVDLFAAKRALQKTKKPPKALANGDECSFKSCESFRAAGGASSSQFPPLPSPAVPKLAAWEMEYIGNAIAQSRRKRRSHADGPQAAPLERKPEPKLHHCRWAIARINEFDDGSKTYEIINTPDGKLLASRATPEGSEIVFAVAKGGHRNSYRVLHQQKKLPSVKSPDC